MTLTRESVVTAAVDLVKSDGFPTLSVRQVAIRMGVTPMALYRHVGDADDLVSATVDRIVRVVPIAAVGDDWHEALRMWARAARTVLSAHPGLTAHLLTTWFSQPAMLEQVEGLLAVAESAGMPDFESVAAANAVLMFVMMRVEAERAVREAKVTRRTLAFATADRATGTTTAQDLPRLRRLAHHYTTARLDAHFDYGLDVTLAGIAAHAHSAPAGSKCATVGGTA